MKRRNFFGFLGLGAFGILGRHVIGSSKAEEVLMPESLKYTKSSTAYNKIKMWTTAQFDKPLTFTTSDALNITYTVSKPPILRIAHPNSVWCAEGLVTPGEWFYHNHGSKECTVLGKSFTCDSLKYVGQKAMRFDVFEHGVGPIEVSTDPTCETFKAIVDSGAYLQKGSSSMYGPVYKVMINDNEYELFCANNSMRHFADTQLGHKHSSCVLSTVVVKHRVGAKWYAPRIEFI